MTTVQKTIKEQSSSISYPSVADYWREDFINLIPQTKRRNEIIEYAEQLDWERIGDLVNSEIKFIMGKISIPQSHDSLRLNSSIVEAIILRNIKNQFHYLFLHYLSNINKNDSQSLKNRKIKELIQKIVYEVSYIRSTIEMLLEFGSIKWIKDSDTLQLKINQLQDSYYGRPYNINSLKLYCEILKHNDEYTIKYGKSNYSLATKHVTKLSGKKFDNFYKAFDRFKERNNIRTYKDFENSIYYSKVDKLSSRP